VYCDGTNFYSAQTASAGNFNVNGNLNVTGSTVCNSTFAANGAGYFATTLGVQGNITSQANIVANGYFSGPGTGLTGTATDLNIGGNAGTVTNGVYNNGGTYNINISGNSNYANTAGTANALNSGNNYYTNDIHCHDLFTSGWVYADSAGNGGDAMVLLRSASSIGSISAVNLANSTYRWLQVGQGSPVLIGADSPANGASLTVGQSNGNGGVWCAAGNSQPGGPGWAMVNPDGRIGGWSVGNEYLQVYVDSTAYAVNLTPSDETVKKNIAPTSYNATDAINKIEFKEFDYDKEKTFRDDHIKCGVISQQLQTIDSDLVRKVGDLLQPDDNKLLMMALKGLQEANARIAALEAQLAK
jgi:hypothetical protein